MGRLLVSAALTSDRASATGGCPRFALLGCKVHPSSAASIVASPLHGDLLVSADLTADEIMPATSKVATLHRRDCSLSVELSTNEISATGGHLCFVHRRSSAVRPRRRRILRDLPGKQFPADATVTQRTVSGQASFAGRAVRKAHSEKPRDQLKTK